MQVAGRLFALTALAGVVGACHGVRGPGAHVSRAGGGDSVEAHAAALRFLAAFDSLQLDAVGAAMASDVTFFMPGGRLPWRRLDGRPAVVAEFRRMFEGVRATAARSGAAAGPPTLGVGPRVRDLRVDMAAPGVAVASFHLGEGDTPGRRTFVFRREGDGVWRVVHSHASSPPPPARAP